MFETALKESKPDARSVTYALQDLNDFVDTHVELCALVYVVRNCGKRPAGERARSRFTGSRSLV